MKQLSEESRMLASLGFPEAINRNSNLCRKLNDLPTRKKSKKPPTEKQLAQQMRWKLAVQFQSKFAKTCKAGFKDRGIGLTGGNLVAQQIMKHAITGTYPDLKIDYSKVVFSRGGTRTMGGFKVEVSETGLLSICWSALYSSKSIADKLILSFYDEVQEMGCFVEQQVEVTEVTASLILPFYKLPGKYHLWIFELTEDRRESGRTYYFKL